jgi:subtilisin family serine protease
MAMVRLWIILALTFEVFLSCQAIAEVNRGDPIFIGKAAGKDTAQAFMDLLRATRAEREARVIVGLDFRFVAEDTLSETAVKQQRRRLNRLQSAVLNRVYARARESSRYHMFRALPYLSLWVNEEELRRLAVDPNVVSIVEDIPGTSQLDASVPFIRAPLVWDEGVKGRGEVIAVVDSGVDPTHPMLASRRLKGLEACFSTNKALAGVYSACPGGKRRVIAPGAGRNCRKRDAIGCGHGTQVAAIAVGSKATVLTDVPLEGVASRARYLSIKAASISESAKTCAAQHSASPCVVYYSTDLMRAFAYIADLVRSGTNVSVVNMSVALGKPKVGYCNHHPLAAIINRLYKLGVPLVTVSGNDGIDKKTTAPGCVRQAITVGSTERNWNAVAAHSNIGKTIDLMAPGAGIRTAALNGNLAIVTGTSFAAPHVSGAVALLKEAYRTASLDEIVDALRCTGRMVERGGIRRPRIDVKAAYDELATPTWATQRWDFAAPADLDAWELNGGNWKVVGGRLELISSPQPMIYAVHRKVCAEAFRFSGNMSEPYYDGKNRFTSAVALAEQFSDNGLYMFNFYVLAFSRTDATSGRLSVWKGDRYDLAAQTASSGVQLCEKFVQSVPERPDFLFSVERSGDKLTFKVNGSYSCDATDSDFEIRDVAILVQAHPKWPYPRRGFNINWLGVKPIPLEELKTNGHAVEIDLLAEARNARRESRQ